jgi:hypothetical protein
VCWAVYLLATWTGRWLEDLRRRFPWMASCCGGAAERPSEGAEPPVPAVAAAERGGWFYGISLGWFGGEAPNQPAVGPEVAVKLV